MKLNYQERMKCVYFTQPHFMCGNKTVPFMYCFNYEYCDRYKVKAKKKNTNRQDEKTDADAG